MKFENFNVEQFNQSRKEADKKLEKGGAEITKDESVEITDVDITDKQLGQAKKEMVSDFKKRIAEKTKSIEDSFTRQKYDKYRQNQIRSSQQALNERKVEFSGPSYEGWKRKMVKSAVENSQTIKKLRSKIESINPVETEPEE